MIPYRDYAELAGEFIRLAARVASTDGLPSALLEVAQATEDTVARLREDVANLHTELAAARRQLEKSTRQRNALLGRINAAERLLALAIHVPKGDTGHDTEEVS